MEQKISELIGVNDNLVKKLNESLLNEEKLKDEIETHLANFLNITKKLII